MFGWGICWLTNPIREISLNHSPSGVEHSLQLLGGEPGAKAVLDACRPRTDGKSAIAEQLGQCSYAIWDWADAQYFISARRFMSSDQPLTSEDTDRFNLQKTEANAGYSAVVYPPKLSPGEICKESLSQDERLPVFAGEAFGDVAWVDVSNLRTRHLSSISLLEILENGEAFQHRHPNGLSRVAVNLGGW